MTCNDCGADVPDQGVNETPACKLCGSVEITQEDIILFPTLESYLDEVSSQTGKSRQTLFNRIRAYKTLNTRGVTDENTFRLNLISTGAVSLLARAEEEDADLIGDSWDKTVTAAIATGNKGDALNLIKFDVLGHPSMYIEMDDKVVEVFRELNLGDAEQYTIESFKLSFTGEWPAEMIEWMHRRLRARNKVK